MAQKRKAAEAILAGGQAGPVKKEASVPADATVHEQLMRAASPHVTGAKPAATQDREDRALKNQMVTFFQRTKSGYYKKTSKVDKQSADEALLTYNSMDDTEKLDFAQAFKTNRGNKNGFGWVKEFTDQIKSKKTVGEQVREKYMSRTYAYMGF
jgi:hypothetical protein